VRVSAAAGGWFFLGLLAPLTPDVGGIRMGDALLFAALPVAVTAVVAQLATESVERWALRWPWVWRRFALVARVGLS
jgi:hypothetical protein